MSWSVAEVIETFLAAGMRRKRLILLPVLIFSALSVLAIFMWPRTYATHALLMLQERQSSDPLIADGGASRQGRLKAEEIDMLLKSERVLASAIVDMNLGKKPLTQREIEGEITSLRKRIGVSVVGSDFIEIELKQSERVGIGERLSIIMTRFFERLLTREDSMKTAREFALEQRQRDVAATSAAIEDWMNRAKAAGAKDDPADAHLAALRQRYADLEGKLAATANSLLPGAVNLAMLEQVLNDEIRAASVRSRASNSLGEFTERVGALKALEAQLEAYRSVGREISEARIANARSMAQSLRSVAPSPDSKDKLLQSEWESLDARIAEALDQQDKHVQRLKRGSGPSLTPFGLIAPDSIRIIDEPRDPELPMTSLLKILVACLAAGIGLGVGFAALAEQLDDRIHDSRGLGALAGVKAVHRVPVVEAAVGAEIDEEGERSSVRGRLAVVSRS